MRTSFEVPFVRGKARVRFYRRGNHVGTYTDDATVEGMALIRKAFIDAGGTKAPKGEPVAVHIHAARHLPESRPKRIDAEPDTFKPDVDNIAKLVLDALNGVAWADDTQVTLLIVSKAPRWRGADDVTSVAIAWGDDLSE